MTPEELGYKDSTEWIVKAVLYAVKEGCLLPVPEPENGELREWVQWGAMRNLHNAIAAYRARWMGRR